MARVKKSAWTTPEHEAQIRILDVASALSQLHNKPVLSSPTQTGQRSKQRPVSAPAARTSGQAYGRSHRKIESHLVGTIRPSSRGCILSPDYTADNTTQTSTRLAQGRGESHHASDKYTTAYAFGDLELLNSPKTLALSATSGSYTSSKPKRFRHRQSDPAVKIQFSPIASRPRTHPGFFPPGQNGSKGVFMGYTAPMMKSVSEGSGAWRSVRHNQAADRRQTLMEERALKVAADIYDKETRPERKHAAELIDKRKRMLLQYVQLTARSLKFSKALRFHRINAKAIEHGRKVKAAVHVLQGWATRILLRRQLGHSYRRRQALKRFILHCRNYYRNKIKVRSAETIVAFLQCCEKQGTVIHGVKYFLARVTRVQKYVQGWCEIKQARLLLLDLVLQKVEGEKIEEDHRKQLMREKEAEAELFKASHFKNVAEKVKQTQGHLKRVMRRTATLAERNKKKSRMIPKLDNDGNPYRARILSETLSRQRHRHIKEVTEAYYKTKSMNLNYNVEDVHNVFSIKNPEELAKHRKECSIVTEHSRKTRFFLMVTKGGARQLGEEVRKVAASRAAVNRKKLVGGVMNLNNINRLVSSNSPPKSRP
eukprot:CAMPEP_0185773794 /NCGR_PEP_ID=MMETSP1174-20130828/75109_1 /TAXON_ID=35687 /ORGANISM="Dictyocha speculum, Strain CCMP1381" /LENGTH=595 /DNA_ID=CAMNT_0028460635 /DNA_START=76 /DNA_END=1863 /DNA_ORIENTATION=-